MEQNEHFKIINFFSPNKFWVGLFSFIYTAVIVFFILLAVVLSLKKYGKIRIIDLILIGLPAWALIALVLVTLESGRWWLHPHWLFTAFKRAAVDTRKREVHFITGFWPFLFNKKYSSDFIDSLVLTSRSIGDFGKKERFGLKVKLKNNDQWTFFDMFKNERAFRAKVKDLSLLLNCQLSDLTYGSSSTLEEETKFSKLAEEKPVKYRTTGEETPGESALKIPKGIKEKKLEDGSYLFFISKRHEWLAFILLIGIWVGIYILTWAVGWTSPSKVGTWEGIWLFFTAVLILFSLKTLLPIKKIQLNKNYLFYRSYCLGIPITRRKIPVTAITKITRQQMELFTFRLVIISDRLTLKVNDLNRDMALYLEETLPRYLLRKEQ
ncbi:MAG: hypothetical protein JSV88_22295 [Candidatus Aminicenantes bacterium]|nr:MAG: hypothetical protein JSV88_22295 [Candidatus Aminicenantes bacterium]